METSNNAWQQFHDIEAPEYDALCFTQNTANEVEFLLHLLQLAPGASLLDVGCGTGRHSVELAKRGLAVTGLDISSGMLSQARAKAEDAGVEVEWIQADATDYNLDKQFDAAICLCEGSFGLLGATDDPIEQPLAILRNLHGCLKPGGKAVFNALSAFKMIRERSDEDVEQGLFDPLTMSTVTEFPLGEGEPPLLLRERSFTPTELKLLFQLAGFSVLHLWGGTAGEWGKRAIKLDEFELMVVAEKAAQ